jgi:polyhydroxybutyrate depolymerase
MVGPGVAVFLIALLSLTACDVHTLRTDDGRREYRVHVPQAPQSPMPVVVVLHGGGGNAEDIQAIVGMDALADTEGFLVVYPDGVGEKRLGQQMNTWNGAYCCGKAVDEDVDDVAFLDTVLDDVAERYDTDPARVYMTGISNGGIMASRYGCERPDRVAAIAPVASPGPPEGCPASSVPTLIVHGTDDGCALYEGGQECGGCWERAVNAAWGTELPDRHFECTGVQDQLAQVAQQNACTDQTTVTLERGAAVCTEHTSCESTAATCVVTDMGHVWPGVEHTCERGTSFCDAYIDTVGETSLDLNNDDLWAFFERHSLEQ